MDEVINLTSEIIHHHFNVKHKIGWGGFGEVYKVVAKSNGKVYALKEMKKIKVIKKKSV